MPPEKCVNCTSKVGKAVEYAGVDHAQRRHHQREFPAQNAAEIVGVHPVPLDHSGAKAAGRTKVGVRGSASAPLNI